MLTGGLDIALVGCPRGCLLGGLLAPAVHHSGRSTIASNAAANSLTNATHLAAFVVASFLLPIGAAGLAHLAYRRTPWLATIGGLLGTVGWLPFSPLPTPHTLPSTIAPPPDISPYPTLLDRFTPRTR